MKYSVKCGHKHIYTHRAVGYSSCTAAGAPAATHSGETDTAAQPASREERSAATHSYSVDTQRNCGNPPESGDAPAAAAIACTWIRVCGGACGARLRGGAQTLMLLSHTVMCSIAATACTMSSRTLITSNGLTTAAATSAAPAAAVARPCIDSTGGASSAIAPRALWRKLRAAICLGKLG